MHTQTLCRRSAERIEFDTLAALDVDV